MREHYNNLNKIQAQDNKSYLQTEKGSIYFYINLHNYLLKVGNINGDLRCISFKYVPII